MPASNRGDFQAIAEERIGDAQALLTIPRYSAAYYLAGYAIECGLKACIARLTREYDFPIRNTNNIYTHDLDSLVRSADLETTFQTARNADAQLELSWTVAKDWKEDVRYELKTEVQARNMYDAALVVLGWIRTQW